MSNHVLVEIGIEELPARFIDDAEKQLKEKTKQWLQDKHIAYEKVQTYSTPRRLAVLIYRIASSQTTIKEEVRGPQEKIAKNEEGDWTKAAIGFTKGQGKTVEDIYVKEVKGTPYIFVEKILEGKQTKEMLQNFSDVISSISFPQTMRWGTDTFRFARPIRWLVALFNDQVIPFEIAHVKTKNVTYGHRFLGEKCQLTNPLAYEETLENNFVIPDPKKRESMILQQMKELEQAEGFHIAVNKNLLQEVRNLVEYPTVFYGQFDKNYLKLPQEALITSMAEHQRYFPVLSEKNGKLLAYFVGVRNGDDQELVNVVRGNEKVLRARLKDAEFFYEEDRNNSIDFYLNKLKTVVFQEKIGTIYEKMGNIKKITYELIDILQLDESVAKESLRAAEICKFDLVTEMVNEFPELQGIMGEIYGYHYGETKEVAQAIREHYYPLQANSELPDSVSGAIISVADKLDTIIGSISVGLIPTGSQDPYGLRRQAIGLLRIITKNNWDLPVRDLLEFTFNLYGIQSDDIKVKIQEFVKDRGLYIMEQYNIDRDISQAVFHNTVEVMHFALQKGQLLSDKKKAESFKKVQESFIRIINLGRKHIYEDIDPTLFETPSEQHLFDTYNTVKANIETYELKFEAENILKQLELLAEPIHEFFEHNMVMADDEQIKQNRLALVHHISNMIQTFADFTRINWRK